MYNNLHLTNISLEIKKENSGNNENSHWIETRVTAGLLKKKS